LPVAAVVRGVDARHGPLRRRGGAGGRGGHGGEEGGGQGGGEAADGDTVHRGASSRGHGPPAPWAAAASYFRARERAAGQSFPQPSRLPNVSSRPSGKKLHHDAPSARPSSVGPFVRPSGATRTGVAAPQTSTLWLSGEKARRDVSRVQP